MMPSGTRAYAWKQAYSNTSDFSHHIFRMAPSVGQVFTGEPWLCASYQTILPVKQRKHQFFEGEHKYILMTGGITVISADNKLRWLHLAIGNISTTQSKPTTSYGARLGLVNACHVFFVNVSLHFYADTAAE